jgi:hypothetical protein
MDIPQELLTAFPPAVKAVFAKGATAGRAMSWGSRRRNLALLLYVEDFCNLALLQVLQRATYPGLLSNRTIWDGATATNHWATDVLDTRELVLPASALLRSSNCAIPDT